MSTSAPGMQPPSYDPYGFAGLESQVSEALLNGPSGELDDVVVPGTDETAFSAFRWVLAWTVLIVVLAFIARTRLGAALIYYGLILLIVLLLVTQYQWFAWALRPLASVGRAINPTQGQVNPNAPETGPAEATAPVGQEIAAAVAQARSEAGAQSASRATPTARHVPTAASTGLLPQPTAPYRTMPMQGPTGY